VKKISSQTLLKIAAAPAVLGLALLSTAANAQEAQSADDADAGEAIIVTGSRIATQMVDAPNPVQVVSADVIRGSGIVNVQDALVRNPVFGTPAISRNNSNFSTSSAGVATVDLRNLGSDRTLVLVNGRRFVAGIPGSSTVDLNTIPTQFIDRIDVQTGGSSAVYGSDAVAGVVNIVTKKNYQGVELSGKIGISERGDNLEQELGMLVGGNFDDNKGNILVYAGYTKQGAVFSRNRSNLGADIDQISCIYTTCDVDQIFEATRPFYSGFAPQGSFTAGQRFDGDGRPIGSRYTFTYSPSGQLQPCFSSNGAGCVSARPAIPDDPDTPNVNEASPAVPDIGTGVGPNGFNRSAYRTIAVPTERYLLALSANYEVSDSINLFVEGNYASTKVRTELEPFPMDSAGPNGIFPASGGLFAIEGYAIDPVTGARTLTRNPLVPLAIYNAAIDTPVYDTNGDDIPDTGDGFRDIGFTKRLSEFGNRGSSVDRDTFRIVAGLNGNLSDRWSYEAYYNYGQTRESQQSGGQVNVLNFANALNVVQDVYDVNGNGDTTDAVCADATARAQGCAPANIFGFNALSQDAINYIIAPSSLTSLTSQNVAGAGLVGSLPGLAAGDIGLAFGVEYRKEKSEQVFDALTNAGLNGGNKLANTYGQFDVKEAYGEIRLPLIADAPFFNTLELSAAGRVSDYSTVGTVYSYNVSGIWAPVRDIRFRATYSQSTRAPNIGELFGGAGQDYPTDLADPCKDIQLTSTGTLATQCLADAGVRANIAANGKFTVNQADIQGISGFNNTNPNLNEEQSKSWTVGVAINPRSINALRGLQLTVDYFDIKIKDAIVSTPRSFILDQCYNQANEDYCSFITRRQAAAGANSAGSLEFIDTTLFNSGGLRTTGLDVTLGYNQNVVNGVASFNLSYTHVFKGYVIPLPGADIDRFAGESGASKDRATGTLAWNNDRMGFTLVGTYIGGAYLDDQFITGALGDPDIHSKNYRQNSRFYLDAQVRFTPGDHYEFFVGANNLLDTSAPRFITGLPFNFTGTETDAGTYDPIGRRYYAGARIRF